MKALPSLRQVQYLLALADRQTFRAAADACAVTQSTLSAGIAELESVLGATLVDRSNRRAVRFTPLGERIVTDSRDLVMRAEKLLYRAQSDSRPFAWPLRLGVIPTIAPYFLPKILKPLQKALPALDLHIHELRSAPLLDRLAAGDLDAGLMAFPYDTPDMVQTVLFEEPFVCAAPPGAFKTRKTLTMADLADHPLLLLEDGHCLRDHALAACSLQPLQDRKGLSAASLATLIQMVHQGYGITLLPAMAADPANLPKNLTLRRFARGAPMRKIGLATPKESLRAADLALFLAQLKILCKTML